MAERQRQNPEHHRAAQQRYASKHKERPPKGSAFSDAAEAASARLSKAHWDDFVFFLGQELAARGLDLNAELEARNIAAGSLLISLVDRNE